MKNVLDHRILIPRSPQTVWQYVSDLNNNPQWQTDCESVSFLTARHTGIGTRWRYRTPDGHERVVEISAWYDGLGYEYSYIDGAPYDDNRGRVRLQEIPEGTVVQWTFSYDTRGFLGGVRNSLTLRRQIDGVLMDSLRMLWKKLNQAGMGEPIREAKSLIREAPDYEERARYKPRHPSKVDLEAAAPRSEVVIAEPPVTDEDTRPSVRPAPSSEADFSKPVEVPVPVPEPESPVTEETPDEPATIPSSEALSVLPAEEPPLASELAASPSLEEPAVELDAVPEEPPVQEPSAEVVVEESPQDIPSFAIGTVTQEQPPAERISEPSAETIRTPVVEPPREYAADIPEPEMSRELVPPEKLAAMDTREVSVFDIFGLPKPSETQESLPPVPAATPEAAKSDVAGVRRIGLRIVLRRKLVKLRRPI